MYAELSINGAFDVTNAFAPGASPSCDSLLHRLTSGTSGLDHGNVFASIGLVISLSRNYASHTATGIRVVAFSARNEVNMTVHYRPASGRATIDPYVETFFFRTRLRASASKVWQARTSADPRSK
jgi:hypothetical protein